LGRRILVVAGAAALTWGTGAGCAGGAKTKDVPGAAGDTRHDARISADPGGPAGPPPGSYAALEPILTARCAGCHAESLTTPAQRQGAPLGVDFDSCEHAGAAADLGNLRVQGGTMPPDEPAAKEEKALFQAWVDGGTPCP